MYPTYEGIYGMPPVPIPIPPVQVQPGTSSWDAPAPSVVPINDMHIPAGYTAMSAPQHPYDQGHPARSLMMAVHPSKVNWLQNLLLLNGAFPQKAKPLPNARPRFDSEAARAHVLHTLRQRFHQR